MKTFRVKKLNENAYAVMVVRQQGLTRVEFAIYETYGRALGGPTAKESATRYASELNNAAKRAGLR